jgi:transposase
MEKTDLVIMSKDEHIDLILWQFKEIERLKKELETLEKKLVQPKKNSRNSSIPPSKEYKKNKKEKLKERTGVHGNGGRELSEKPDEIVDFKATKCLECENVNLDSKLISSYDKIILPEVKIKTVRVNLYECFCKKCNKVIKTEVPEKLSNRELLSNNLKAMIMYLHYENYVSFKRIEKYFKEIYGIEISQGLIDNVIKSSNPELIEKVKEIKKSIQSSELVCSDETSARVKGKTYWQWVFQNSKYSYHVIEKTRGSIVKEELFGENHPAKYVSDAFSAQKVGVKEWQVCLAHQIRDCNYLIELDNNEFALKMKYLFQEAIKEKDSDLLTKKQKKIQYLSMLEEILKIQTETNSEKKLRKRFSKFKDNLFMFLDYDNVPPTNNSSEQALRPSVIFRKVTNGFRSELGKQIFANFRSVIDTAKKQGFNVFQSIVEIFSYNKNNQVTI